MKKNIIITVIVMSLFLLSHSIVLAGMPPPASFAGISTPVPDRATWVEEVLYRVELTPKKLMITVATGGCTDKDNFHVDVNKDVIGPSPYKVTVYKVKPDICTGNFEPKRLSFLRKELGLEGIVEFTVRNRIGNTTQHLLAAHP